MDKDKSKKEMIKEDITDNEENNIENEIIHKNEEACIENKDLPKSEEELELELKRQELEGREKKLKFMQMLLEKKISEYEKKEEMLLDEKDKLDKKRLSLNDEVEKKAQYIVGRVTERNKELSQKVTELTKMEVECSSIKNEINDKEEQINSLKEELVDCRTKLKKFENDDGIKDISYLKERIRELECVEEEKNKLLKENKSLKEKINELEIKNNEITILSDNNEILKNKLERAQSYTRYIKNLEMSKGNGDDSSERIFEEIINRQTDKDKNSSLKNYNGDENFISEFIKFCRKHGFIYDEKLIRTFICSLRSSKLTILKGYSGTGKSSLPTLFAKFLKSECVVIPVQPNWRTKQDIVGFYNYFTNKFIPTELTQTLIRANVSRNRIFFVVLDEMNLSRVEYYFSEFNSKLWADENSRYIELFDGISNYSEKVSAYIKNNCIKIPDNIYFIGTINEDDSVSPISDKIFDRAQVVEFMQLPSGKTVGNIDEACRSAESDDEYTSFQSFKNRNHSEEVNIDIIDSVNEYTKTYFNKVIGFRSLMQVKEFTRFYTLSGGIRKDAIDMQLVSKFVPKLKLLYSEEQKDNLYMLIEEIKELFKKDFNCKDSELDELMIVKKLNEVIREIEY